jgi:hypothetical protein
MYAVSVCTQVGVVFGSDAKIPNLSDICLNGEWQYQIAASGVPLKTLPGSNWESGRIRVPSPWNDKYEEFLYPDNLKAAGGLYYRRLFNVPSDAAGKRIHLEFMAVDFETNIWVNGQHVGENRLAMVPFDMDITGKVNIGAKNELIVSVRDVSSMIENGHAVLPFSLAYVNPGIVDDVFLRFYPSVYIRDVFIKPSVRQNQLVAQFEICNESTTAFTGQIHCNIVPANNTDSVVKRLPEVNVTVGPNSIVTVTAGVSWSNPTFWWPNNPYLYFAKSRLSGGLINHETNTRFGFREFWCDGVDFKLNGKRIFLAQTVSMMTGMTFGSYLLPDYMRALWTLYKETGCNVDRLHGQPFPDVVAATADECGMLIIPEGLFLPYLCPGLPAAFGNLDDTKHGINYEVTKYPELWKEYYRRWIRYNRNHPSVVMYSIFNEMQWKQSLKPLMVDVVRETDPTRPIYCDGAGDDANHAADRQRVNAKLYGQEDSGDGAGYNDLNGLGDVLSRHYNLPSRTSEHSNFNPSYRFPHVCYASDGVDIHYSYSDGNHKPVSKGEYTVSYDTTADLASFYSGDKAYQGMWAIEDHNSGFWQTVGQIGRDEGHGLRYQGLNALCWQQGHTFACGQNSLLHIAHQFEWKQLDTPGMKPKKALTYLLLVDPWSDPHNPRAIKTAMWPYLSDVMSHQLVILPEPGKSFYSGQVVTRRFAVINGTFDDLNNATVKWTLGVEGRSPLVQGQRTANVLQGTTYKDAFAITLPDVNVVSALVFTVRCENDGQLFAQRKQNWAVFPRLTASAIPYGREFVCYDPNNTMGAVLTAIGRTVDNMNAKINRSGTALLIAPDALDTNALKLLDNVLGAGGNAVVLPQTNWPQSLLNKFGLKPDPGARSMGFVRNPQHELLRDINFEAALCHWGAAGEIADTAMIKPTAGNIRDMVDSDNDRSLMLEIRSASGGSCVITTLKSAFYTATNPGAGRMLVNAIDYIRTADSWQVQDAFLIADSNSSLRAGLTTCKANLAATQQTGAPILVDAGKSASANTITLLTNSLNAGGTVYLHSLTPSSISSFSSLLGGIQLDATGVTKCQNFELNSFDQLTANLAGVDIFYPEIGSSQVAPYGSRKSSWPSKANIVASEPAYVGDLLGREASCDVIIQWGGWSLTSPGAVMATVPYGNGKIVLCQIQWDKFLPNNRMIHVGQAILNGLGVMISSPPPQCMSYLPADLNHDCKVDFQDFVILAAQWLKCNDSGNPNCRN